MRSRRASRWILRDSRSAWDMLWRVSDSISMVRGLVVVVVVEGIIVFVVVDVWLFGGLGWNCSSSSSSSSSSFYSV